MEKTVAVVDFVDGAISGVLGSSFVFSIENANGLADALGQREAQLDARRTEQEQAAAKAAQLAKQLQSEIPTFEEDVRDFKLLLKALREKITAQGGTFPDERFEKYI